MSVGECEWQVLANHMGSKVSELHLSQSYTCSVRLADSNADWLAHAITELIECLAGRQLNKQCIAGDQLDEHLKQVTSWQACMLACARG